MARRTYRTDRSKAATLLERLIPSESRRAVAKIFMTSIRSAHLQSPSCWELTLEPTFIRLNVGQVALLDLIGGQLFLCAAPSLPPIDRPARVDRSPGPVYAAVPVRSVSAYVPVGNVGMLNGKVVAAHHRYIAEAASRKRISPFRSAHSPAAVRVLAEWASVEALEPGYIVAAPDESELSQREVESAIVDVVAAKEIERVAILTVTTWYEARGWTVVSVEREKIGYDLRCTKGRKELHVEVKGRADSGGIVLLTANEWRRAIDDKCFMLAIVSDIRKSGGFDQMTGREFQRAFDIKPIVFHAKRRGSHAG